MKNLGVEILRVAEGRFMTSLEMHGFSLTVLLIDSEKV